MTKVFKVQEKDFMRNAMDSRLRGNDKGMHETMGGACAGMTVFFRPVPLEREAFYFLKIN